ncbi:transmembrane protein 145-like isoform X1 [Asterias amurensis]|uniref:transmembrane protein 145-like isoform X1 n=1 Tax=Asterias amurensis TaxID=7602 RepID=UPI003AB30413
MTGVAVLMTAFVLMLTSSSVIDGKYVEGVVDTSKDMEFLERFVFEPNELGQLWYEYKYPAEDCCYQVLFFNDAESQWPYVRANQDKLTCVEKLEQIPSNYNAVTTLSTHNCKNKTEDGRQMLVCTGTRHFVAPRARWWFINIANCNGISPRQGIYMQYKLNMTNGDRPIDKHFSADERFTLQTSIAFAILYFLMALTGVYYRFQLAKQRLLHSTYQLFFASVCMQLIALIFIIIALACFAGDGIEMPGLKTTGHIVSSLGDVLFVLMLMLVGKGYTITRGRLSTSGSIKLAIFTCLYAGTFIFLYVYAQSNFDPRDVMFIYDSPAAMALIVLRCIGVVWLYYCVFFTIKHFASKFKFYVPFMLFFAVWFVAEPVMIGVANEFIPTHKRAKIVNGIYWSAVFLGHMIFLVLTRPDRTNEYFPYHIKTNQIGAMLMTDSNEADFTNPYIGEPLTRSLTNIFVTTPPPKVDIPPPYTISGLRAPRVNNFIQTTLRAVSHSPPSSSPCDSLYQQTQAASAGPNLSVFCVERELSPGPLKKVNNNQPPSAPPQTASPPKGERAPGRKASFHLTARKSSSQVVPGTPPSQDQWMDKRRITDQEQFVEIPLNDLTVTDF